MSNVRDQLLPQSWQVMNARACRVTGGEFEGGLSTSWLGEYYAFACIVSARHITVCQMVTVLDSRYYSRYQEVKQRWVCLAENG